MIATVLLIAMVVVIALIVFVWFKGMVGEGCEKFGGACELICDDVEFDASYSSSSGTLSIVNTGNAPIFKMNMKLSEAGGHSTEEVNLGDSGLREGGTFSESISVSDADKITLNPILAGTSKEGIRTYVCEEQYGKEITL